MDAINFKARFITNTTIKRLNETTGRYDDKVVSLIKMNKESSSDFFSLLKLCTLWNVDVNYIGTMLLALNNFDTRNRDIYILTEQEDDFRKLIPEKILGVEEIAKQKNSYRLDYIQTNPKEKYKTKERKYKEIGGCLLNFMLDKFGKYNKIYLNSVKDAVDFYKKFGFKIINSNITDPLMVHNPTIIGKILKK